ncbi:helix-turn-helix domain-containing protein [Halococcus sp. IIIV-5B]|uniref:helix-turn-helix domain-containing protein n=1 Tax=Halococcus sp. IIIV-5B TaxID=2321230 RepID=UPI000E7456B9|nr:helix-turn-helix domain-containing protein [Halococcus sp. IIIV-5B]RJT07579.1 DNA-binding protein [Halococcus sp. IIIV-5B]
MACIVRGTIPADEFALYKTSMAISDVEFEVERLVESGDGMVMPLLWIRGPDPRTVEKAFAEDPSVRDVSLLAEFDTESLYRMEWTQDVQVVVQMLTTAEATVTDAYGRDGIWMLRVLYPTRESVTGTVDFCREEGLTFDIEMVREFEGKPAGRYGLTDDQFEALRVAHEQGYFDIPRKATAKELAEEIGISHQALSERLRRGHDVLIEDTIIVGSNSSETETDN